MSSQGPEVVEVQEQVTAVVGGEVPFGELPSFFDRSFSSLGEVLAGEGLTPTGPPFARYHGPPGGTVALEVGFPVDRPPRGREGVTASRLPAGRVVRLVHEGAYGGLSGSWERLVAWADAAGLERGPVLWEVYLTEPTPDADPSTMRTQLNWMLAG
jgi:effector-binding domain-containing protein